MNKRNFLKKTFKLTSFFSVLLLPFNIIFKNQDIKFKKIFKKNQNKIWILKSDDL